MQPDRLVLDEIQRRLTTRRVGRRMELYDEVDSTNTRAVLLARQDPSADGAVIIAEYQTQGRGRLGRQWLAPPGSSLLMSLILRPRLLPSQAQRATMTCALAAVQAVAQVTSLQASIKWPNDIVLAGRKLGGLLTELGLRGPELDYIVVGIGLNVNLDTTALGEVTAPPTSLSSVLGRRVSRLDLLVTFLQALEPLEDQVRQGVSPIGLWREHLSTLGKPVQVTFEGDAIVGIAEDVDEDGALLVRTSGGDLRTILAGDVTLRR